MTRKRIVSQIRRAASRGADDPNVVTVTIIGWLGVTVSLRCEQIAPNLLMDLRVDLRAFHVCE